MTKEEYNERVRKMVYDYCAPGILPGQVLFYNSQLPLHFPAKNSQVLNIGAIFAIIVLAALFKTFNS